MFRILILGVCVLLITCTTPGPWKSRTPLPPGKTKTVVLTFDDGLIQDRRLVELLNRYGLKGTFFLNSGLLGEQASWTNPPTHYVKASEVSSLYQGHEVGGHTLNHPNLLELSPEKALREVLEDKEKLETLTGKRVTSFAYPFGLGDKSTSEVLKATGYHSGRLITKGPPQALNITNPLLLIPSAHMNQAPMVLENFLKADNPETTLIFWGHSWELDQDPRQSWADLEEVFKTLQSHPEVWSGTMGEVFP